MPDFFVDVAWPRGSGEVRGSAFAPVTVVQEEVDVASEPFFPDDGPESAFREQGYIGSGESRRHVVASQGES